MKLKINKRIILGISIPLLVIFIVAGLNITYRSGTMHGEKNDKIMPWENHINLEGTDYIRYFYNTVKGTYAKYPWVVQISYIIVLLCILLVFIVSIIMAWDIYTRKKNARMFNEIKQKYYGTLSEIVKQDRILARSEIYSMIMPDRITESSYTYRMRWIELFILLRADTDLKEPSITNIRNTMEILGLSEFMENRLIYGKDKEKLRVIQAARLLDMQLSDSIMTGIVNNRDIRLHKAARFYYMLINKDDPYLFFENDKMNDQFSVWDKLELHQLFADCHEAGKKLPSFIPLIRQLSNPEIAAFFIKETAYWGNDIEVGYLEEYFDSPNQSFRRAAFEGMGLRRFAQAEEKMKECFFNQSESLKRVILESILAIKSGNSIDFIKEAFYTSASRFTKRTALYCLWHYNKHGQTIFTEMKKLASPDELVLFDQIDRTNIQ